MSEENYMRIIDLRGKKLTRAEMLEAMPRAEMGTNEATDLVQPILDDVKARGAAALRDFAEKFDHIRPENLRVPVEAMKTAVDELDPEVRAAIEESVRRSRAVSASQVPAPFHTDLAEGARVSERWIPVQRVGLYVPGGTAAYPSSVLMNAIPAKIAGVQELIMVTPPGKDGRPNQDILAAASIAGVDRVFLMGGAQAAAALAFGTQRVPKVDKIVGPGNIFVATAKKQLYGVVDIDMIAGPSEILVLADETAKPEFLAADLMSQAEHDKLASAILLTPSQEIAEKTKEELERQIRSLSRKEIIEASLRDFGMILVCRSMEEAVDFANELAPEHLEVCCANPMEYIGRLDNAGSVFLGNYSPEPLGDYYAGPNHVLPTSGTARFFSPLSVDSFIKKSSFIYYTEDALREAKDPIASIAQAEGLTAHAHSIQIRF